MKTFKNAGSSQNHSERGSALITVIILCGFSLMLIASYLMTHSNQAKISYRGTLQNEGRNAAEGVAEVALAELHRRSQANPSFGAGTNPDALAGFTLSNSYKDFMAPAGNTYSHVVKASLEFKNSPLSNAPSAPAVIDASDPVNAQDTSIDQTPLSIRSMNIFAKAAVLDPRTGTALTSYVAENVQIRDQTWFNYAIFYNMDMEFHAGPNFTVFGPVHTNANAYLTEGAGAKLQFYSTLTSVGKLYRYDKYNSARGGHTGDVECSKATGMLAANLVAMGTDHDSTSSGFNSWANTTWKGFVQDSSFSVAKFNPPGLKAYIPDNFVTTTTNELRNNGYTMIEPQLSQVTTHVDPYTGIDDYGYKGEDTENLKFSALSGFVIQVKPPTAIGIAASGVQPQWQLVLYQATDITKRISADNPPARDATTGLPIIAAKINPFTDLDEVQSPPGSGAGQGQAVVKQALKAALLNAIVSIPYRDGGSTTSVWGNSTTALLPFSQAFPANITDVHWPIYDRREGHTYTSGSDSLLNMQGAMHVLKINFGLLNTLLNDASLWNRPYAPTSPWTSPTTLKIYDPALSYTGVVYVQVPLAPRVAARFAAASGSTPEGDKIRPAQRANPSSTAKTPGYAVVVTNATVVPQLASGFNVPDGFTIATNAPIYIWGHFNADGNTGTGTSTTPDNANERPALIAADAVTILSANSAFVFSTMYNTKANAAAFTEISAAIMGGLVPTQPGVDNIWSGGVHNLVRYLEDWGGDDYRFRGSIGVIYESEVAKGTYNEDHNPYYDPPDRDMGYHQYLAQGRFPPATPIKRTVRRMNVRDITAAEYNGTVPTPPAVN